MLLFPKKTKFNKSFSGKKISAKNNYIISKCNYANIVLYSIDNGKISNFQLEYLRRFLRRNLKKKAQIFFRVFPSIPITKKPNDVRLGRGKGNLKY
jgi:large subunit ribosomal protein L16